jgi:solute carrier family 25 (mitochondrial phosphate transporter), member 3
MQVNSTKYPGFVGGARTIIKEEGMRGLIKGIGPTGVGYSLQGAGKFGGYEIFKDLYANMLGEEQSYKYRDLVYIAASASGEFFADMLLCPFEMTKVRVQASPKGEFPVKFGPALAAMRSNAAETRFPFGSIVPLWGRQIPYTIAKFLGFERVVEAFYTHVFAEPKDTYSTSTQLGVTFASGYIAGVLCAVVSHPADNIVSLMGKHEHKGKGFVAIATEVGAKDLMLKGLLPRIVMIGTLTGFQWWIYDSFKTFMHMGTTGGAVKR